MIGSLTKRILLDRKKYFYHNRRDGANQRLFARLRLVEVFFMGDQP